VSAANVSRGTLPNALARGAVLASFMLLPRIEIAEILACSGFDAVILDLEHGPIAIDDVPPLAAAIQGSDMFAIVRTSDPYSPTIAAVLDTGVDGIIVPHVSTTSEAQAVVRAARYPPAGTRSLNPYVRGLQYGTLSNLPEANDRFAVFVMVEGTEAIAQLDGLAAVDGLDGAFVGPVDLSSELGVPGQPEHQLVIEAVSDIFRRLRNAHTAAAIYAPTPHAARRWLTAGASLVALSADIAMLRAAAATMRNEVTHEPLENPDPASVPPA
jgi:4-hydroxy-2-oxoheptanedioate aldolase